MKFITLMTHESSVVGASIFCTDKRFPKIVGKLDINNYERELAIQEYMSPELISTIQEIKLKKLEKKNKFLEFAKTIITLKFHGYHFKVERAKYRKKYYSVTNISLGQSIDFKF